jgi:hypothetical protein
MKPEPFFLIVADYDQGFFSVEGPMTGPGRTPLATLATSWARAFVRAGQR